MARRRVLWLVLFALMIPIGAGSLWLAGAFTRKDAEPIHAIIKVEPQPDFALGDVSRSFDADQVKREIETHAHLVTSQNVLLAAAASTEVSSLPSLRAADDVSVFLADHLLVEVVPDSRLIRIEARKLPPKEGVVIVKAVVKNFLRASSELSSSTNLPLIHQLEGYERELEVHLRRAIDEAAAAEVRYVAMPGSDVNVVLDVAKDQLRDCLGRLRQVQLDAETAPAGQSDKLFNQAALLAAEAERLAERIADVDDGGIAAGQARDRLEYLNTQLRSVQAQVAFVEFAQRIGTGLIVLQEPRLP